MFCDSWLRDLLSVLDSMKCPDCIINGSDDSHSVFVIPFNVTIMIVVIVCQLACLLLVLPDSSAEFLISLQLPCPISLNDVDNAIPEWVIGRILPLSNEICEIFCIRTPRNSLLLCCWLSCRLCLNWWPLEFKSVVIATACCNFTWFPFRGKPISRKLDVSLRLLFLVLDCVVQDPFREATISICNSTWPASLNMEVSAWFFIIFFFINGIISQGYSSSTSQALDFVHLNTAAVIDCHDFYFTIIISNHHA